MDWTIVITRNHALLVRIVAELFAMLRMVDGGSSSPLSVTGCARDTSPRKRGEVKAAEVEPSAELLTSPLRGEVSAKPTERGLPSNASTPAFTLPRHLYAAIMLILRPCESAIRRLIIIAARGLVLKARASRPLPAGLASFASENPSRTPSFQLIDPLKHFDPDLWDQNIDPASLMHEVLPFDPALAHHQAQLAAKPVNATLLFNRLRAMRHALNDLPRQARRLARWYAQRDLLLAAKGPYRPMRMSPFRPGPPPGYRRKDLHQVDAVLKDVHYFAIEAFRADTS